MFGKTHSLETKTKIREALKGKTFYHSEEYKAKMSAALKGRSFSEETKAKMSEAKKGKTLSEETKAKIVGSKGTAVEVFDKETNETTTYSSGRQAAKVLGCGQKTVCRHIKSKKLFKGRYLIVKQNP